MHFRQNKDHAAELMFPLVLLLLFAVCALLVLLLATTVYRRTAEVSSSTDHSRIAVSYLVEKVHQQDASGAVALTEFDGCTALELKCCKDGVNYSTFLYVCDGMLRELLLKEGAKAAASGGRAILPLQQLEMEVVTSHLIRFTAVSESGYADTAFAALHGEGAEP